MGGGGSGGALDGGRVPRRVFGDTHGWVGEMPAVLSAVVRVRKPWGRRLFAFPCVLGVSCGSSFGVGAGTLSGVRLEGPQLLRKMRGRNSLTARAAYSANNQAASSRPDGSPFLHIKWCRELHGAEWPEEGCVVPNRGARIAGALRAGWRGGEGGLTGTSATATPPGAQVW